MPLREAAYPEPRMLGLLPAGAVYARHAQNLQLNNVIIRFAQRDTRPRVVLEDVAGVGFTNCDFPPAEPTSAFVLHRVHDFALTQSPGRADVQHDDVDNLTF